MSHQRALQEHHPGNASMGMGSPRTFATLGEADGGNGTESGEQIFFARTCSHRPPLASHTPTQPHPKRVKMSTDQRQDRRQTRGRRRAGWTRPKLKLTPKSASPPAASTVYLHARAVCPNSRDSAQPSDHGGQEGGGDPRLVQGGGERVNNQVRKSVCVERPGAGSCPSGRSGWS